jgi:hypothetical protein
VVSGIYGGLISGYTARMAGFAGEQRLDRILVTEGYCGRFMWGGRRAGGEIDGQLEAVYLIVGPYANICMIRQVLI